MSFTFSSLKNAKKIDWDLKKAFTENYGKLNDGDKIKIVLEIVKGVKIKNEKVKKFKTDNKRLKTCITINFSLN